jgi:serine/threonine protein phosphatase 1
MLTIVIGDIHGMAAKLENLLGQIDMWCAANAKAELRQLIFLGDYIDRGPDSRQVLQIVQPSKPRALSAFGAITKS